MAWRRRDEASTSAIGLSVAAGTFAIAFVTATFMVEQPGGMDPRVGELDLAATTALEVIVIQSGSTVTGLPWADDPDIMLRFGLATDEQENFLDYRKIKAMRNASLEHDGENNAPDYEDVRAALGISDKDFHLRTYPVLPDLDDPRWTKDPRGRLAFVGHVDSAQGNAFQTTYANTTSKVLNVSVAVRNEGADPHIFKVSIGIGDLTEEDIIAKEDRHTRLLEPGEVQTVWARFPTMDYDPTITGVSTDVSDAYGNKLIDEEWTAATEPTATEVTWAPLLAAGQAYYRTTEKLNFVADHFEGDGTRLNSAQSAHFVLVGPNGDEWVNTSKTSTPISLPKNKAYTYECANCTMAGTYRATLWDTGLTRYAMDLTHVSATALFDETETLSATSAREVNILKELIANFNGIEHNNATAPEGDVFVDSSHIRDLDNVLSRYTTLIVGSEVKQNAMNSAQTKWAIADWVQAGGNLIVLGTDEVQSRWLEPVYQAAQETANGGIGAPDPTHPVLSTPNKLDYQRYVDYGKAWRIKEGQPFTHVLSKGAASSGDSQDVLALSEPGAYNDGTVVLTSYMAGAITSPQDDQEAKRFLHNLLSQSYNMLFLDYGPPIPDDTPVGSAQRLVAVPHPNVPGAVVEVKIVMYTW